MQFKVGSIKVSATTLLQGAILLLLFGNLLIMLAILNKTDALVERNALWNWGSQNLYRLENVYKTSAYQNYFSGEITLLEKKISQTPVED